MPGQPAMRLLLMLICSILGCSPAWSADDDIHAVAGFLERARASFVAIRAQALPVRIVAPTTQALHGLIILQAQVWNMIGLRTDAPGDVHFVDPVLERADYLAAFPPPGNTPTPDDVEIVRALVAVDAGVRVFKSSSQKFKGMSDREIVSTLDQFRAADPFATSAGAPSTDTMSGYARHIDAVIGAVETQVNGNRWYDSLPSNPVGPYKIAADQKWSVYRAAVAQVKRLERNAGTGNAFAQSQLAKIQRNGEIDLDLFVSDALERRDPSLYRAAVGYDEAHDRLDNPVDYTIGNRPKTVLEIANDKAQLLDAESTVP